MTTSASGHLGDSLAEGVAEPPPPKPPAAIRQLEKDEEAGAEELRAQREEGGQGAVAKDIIDAKREFELTGNVTTMHACEAEWAIFLRRANQAICRMEGLRHMRPMAHDAPGARPETYFDMYI